MRPQEIRQAACDTNSGLKVNVVLSGPTSRLKISTAPPMMLYFPFQPLDVQPEEEAVQGPNRLKPLKGSPLVLDMVRFPRQGTNKVNSRMEAMALSRRSGTTKNHKQREEMRKVGDF